MRNNTLNVHVSDGGLRGRPGLVWRGDFSETADYYLGDAVSYGGSSYVVVAHSPASQDSPDTSPNYSVLALKGTNYEDSVANLDWSIDQGEVNIHERNLPDSILIVDSIIDGGTY